METTIITAFLASLTPVVVQIISNHTKQRALDATLARHEQKQQDDITLLQHELVEVKKRLDTHNGYAEKITSQTKDIEYIKDKIKAIDYCKLK